MTTTRSGGASRRLSRWIQLTIFLLIIGVGAAFFLYVYYSLAGEQQQWYAGLSLAYFIPPAGKETVIFVGLNRGLPFVAWVGTLWVFDLLVCVAIMTNWWIFELLIHHIPPFPFIGIRRKKPHVYRTVVSLKFWYEKLQRKTQEIERKYVGKVLLLMLMVFMFIPFQGTGAMSTTIIGTTLGLRKRTITCVVLLGSFLSILLVSSLYYGLFRL
ncbi:MAG: small multi-drug export protein [Candidatus Thermoplasmatota archaeon]|nr:small multi-drug export protein [Candidatus Thermoplasmatota archaeon]